MNEELLDDLSAAMKRRDKALAARARWQEALDDAEEDIREMSARITDIARVENPTGPEPELYRAETSGNVFEPTVWTPEQV